MLNNINHIYKKTTTSLYHNVDWTLDTTSRTSQICHNTYNLTLDLIEMAAKPQSFNLDKTSILVILNQVLYRNSTPFISMRSNISGRHHKNQMMNKELCKSHLHTCTFTSSHKHYCRSYRALHNN